MVLIRFLVFLPAIVLHRLIILQVLPNNAGDIEQVRLHFYFGIKKFLIVSLDMPIFRNAELDILAFLRILLLSFTVAV